MQNIEEPDKYRADIAAAVAALRKGGVILYPTDTVWGLGCDATDADAVARIFKIKQRADSKALITLVGSLAQLERTVEGIPEVAYDLIEYSERPLTIVYDSAAPGARIAPNLPAPDGTLAVRLSTEEFSRRLCLAFGKPLVSTSANISGETTPRCFAEISPAIVDSADYVCTSRRDDDAKDARPSTVMRLSADGLFKIIRP